MDTDDDGGEVAIGGGIDGIFECISERLKGLETFFWVRLCGVKEGIFELSRNVWKLLNEGVYGAVEGGERRCADEFSEDEGERIDVGGLCRLYLILEFRCDEGEGRISVVELVEILLSQPSADEIEDADAALFCDEDGVGGEEAEGVSGIMDGIEAEADMGQDAISDFCAHHLSIFASLGEVSLQCFAVRIFQDEDADVLIGHKILQGEEGFMGNGSQFGDGLSDFVDLFIGAIEVHSSDDGMFIGLNIERRTNGFDRRFEDNVLHFKLSGDNFSDLQMFNHDFRPVQKGYGYWA